MPASLVVIPTYNEAENIEPLIREVLARPERVDILVTDDHSPDGTAERVRHLQKDSEGHRIHLLLRDRKEGLGKAYRASFEWALRHGAPLICQMDADFSHAPTDLSRLLQATNDADLVLGARYVAGGSVIGWPWRRWLLSRGANLLARHLTGIPLSDLTSGFKCYRRSTVVRLLEQPIASGGYTFQIETTVRTFRAGFRVREIPITFRERRRGLSKIASTRVTWETLMLLFRLAQDRASPGGASIGRGAGRS